MASKRILTAEQKARQRDRIRDYRRRNPERVRQWRRNYILAAAARLQAEASGGADRAGD